MFRFFRSSAVRVRKIASAAIETLECRTFFSSISGVASSAASAYDLTQLGTSDWAHWGTKGSATAFVDDANGGSQISNANRIGSGDFGGYSAGARSVSWTNGSPASAVSGDGGFIWANNGIGSGYSFTVPADTSTRTIYVYVGGYSSGTSLAAHLSDGSASDYSVSFYDAGNYSDVVAITYSAASSGQTLTISYTKTQTIGSTNGSADLVAAWLTTGGSSTNPTQPTSTPPQTDPPVSTPPSTTSGTLPDGSALPGPSNTGPAAGTSLTPFDATDGFQPHAGEVVRNLAITGWVEVSAPDVTFINCTFVGPTTLAGGGMFTVDSSASNCVIENMSFTGGPTNTSAIQNNAAGTQILNCSFVNLPVQGVYSSQSVTIQGCYFHDIGWDAAGIGSNPLEPLFDGGAHTEDIYISGGSYSEITGNNLDTPIHSSENGVQYAMSTAEIFYDPQGGANSGTATITNNVIAGDGDATGSAPGSIFYLLGNGPYTIADNQIGTLLPNGGYIYDRYIGGPWSWYNNVDPNGTPIAIPTGLPVAGTA